MIVTSQNSSKTIDTESHKPKLTNNSLCKVGYRQLFHLLLFLPACFMYVVSFHYVFQTLYTNINDTIGVNTVQIKTFYPMPLKNLYSMQMKKQNGTYTKKKPYPKHEKPKAKWRYDLECYNSPQVDKRIPVVPGYRVRPNSIFFIETSCRHKDKFALTKRQVCAYEAAARANPNSEVLVLFPSPITLTEQGLLVSRLLKYPNIKLVHVDVDRFFAGTPFKYFDLRKRMANSRWPVIHFSDILRLVTLWKYGGTYLDWDYFSFRSFGGMTDFAGGERSTLVNNAVLNFKTDGSGRQILNDILLDLVNNFGEKNYLYNGPSLITRVMQRICHETKTIKMTPKKCKGFTVFPPPPWSPIYPAGSEQEARSIMKRKMSESAKKRMSRSFGYHMTNSFVGKMRIKTGSKVLFDVLASEYCPRVYSVFGAYF